MKRNWDSPQNINKIVLLVRVVGRWEVVLLTRGDAQTILQHQRFGKSAGQNPKSSRYVHEIISINRCRS